MHISDGILSAQVLSGSWLITIIGTGIGLKKIDQNKIVYAGMLSATFFIVSLIHVNIGIASTHLILNGIMSIFLGWSVFPAILVALTMQYLFFQFGGITTLGINTLNMAVPSLLCYYIFTPFIKKNYICTVIASFLIGFFSVFMAAILLSLSLYFTNHNFLDVAKLILISHFPIMIVEGIITAFFVSFIKKVHPIMLPGGA